ncbi:hypothetical protein BH11PSE11_BH11PSE11_36390 [soil metagenome]
MEFSTRFLVLICAISAIGCSRRAPEAQAKLDTLSMAAEYGNVARVRELATTQAIIDQFDSSGYSPLMHAVANRHLEAAKILVSLGADTSIKHRSGSDLIMLSLLNSMEDPSLEMLNYLIGLGLNPGYVTPSGECALDIAIDFKHEAAVIRLISAGAMPTKKSIQLVNAKDYPSEPITARVVEAAARGRKAAQKSPVSS